MSKQTPNDCVALVLAAGHGSRFGGDKRLAQLPDGGTVLARTLAVARAAFADVIVVVQAEDNLDSLPLPRHVTIVRAPMGDIGMGSSLAAGVDHLGRFPNAASAAILLADMPWISPVSLASLVGNAEENRIVLPCFSGKRGHPVIFGRRFWPELAGLSGDIGGRNVIESHRSACHKVIVDDPAILQDIDRPGDLLQARYS